MKSLKLARPSKKFKKNDVVQVIAGKDRGKQGKILKVLVTGKLVVEGISMAIHHEKPNAQRGTEGGRVSKERAIHHSNVAHINTVTGAIDRVGFKFVDQNGLQIKVRYFKSNGEILA